MKTPPTTWPQVYLCVALTTMATLLLELSLTRIFSVVFYYHFAFLAISIALFGMGAGGVFSYLVAGWKAPLFTRLGRLSAVNSLLVVGALIGLLAQPNNPSNWDLALVYFTTALPFFGAGAIVSLAISETIERVNRVYFWDLAGAAGGCLLLIPLLNQFGGPSTVLAVAILFAVAGAIWHSMAGSVAGRARSVALALILVAFLTYNQKHHVLDIRHAKGRTIAEESFVRWNSFSRIGVREQDGMEMIFIDADASTAIADFDFDHLTAHERHDLLEQGPALPYAVRPGAKTLIIGPGGGWDVARALASGSHDMTGVEINPIIATTIMRERFPDLSRGLYLRPDVHILRGRRPQLRAAQHRQIPGDPGDAGGYMGFHRGGRVRALREQPVHHRCPARLPDAPDRRRRDGFHALGIRSAARIAAPGGAGNRGARQTRRERAVAPRDGGPRRLRPGLGRARHRADLAQIVRRRRYRAGPRAVHRGRNAGDLLARRSQARNQFFDLLRSPDPEDYERQYTFDISPVTDNRPFFFYTVQPRDLWSFVTDGVARHRRLQGQQGRAAAVRADGASAWWPPR